MNMKMTINNYKITMIIHLNIKEKSILLMLSDVIFHFAILSTNNVGIIPKIVAIPKMCKEFA